MNKVVAPGQMAMLLRDTQAAADVAMRQLGEGPDKLDRSVADVFLHEPFALGYACGFSERACHQLNRDKNEQNCGAYVQEMIGAMLGDVSVSASFVSFALSKSGDRDFEGGYDAGAGDLDAWYFGYGEYLPSGLIGYLRTSRKYS